MGGATSEPIIKNSNSPPSSQGDLLPPYLGFVYPTPGSILPKKEYETTMKLLDDTKPSVCVSFWTFYLLEPGDDLSVDEALSRLRIEADGQQVSKIYAVLLTEDEPLLPQDPDTGNPVAQFEGGSNISGCFAVTLDTGSHTVSFIARKTSGEELRYTWSFTLTEE
jgi:hypothetical protein